MRCVELSRVDSPSSCCLLFLPARTRSKYPSSLTSKDEEGKLIGNVGSVELLNSRVLSSQPFVSYDWSPDKEGLAVGSCLDQSLRVFIVTKLNLY